METVKSKMSNVTNTTVYGVNKYGQTIKEHDKLLCGNGQDTWFTHVMFDSEKECWHREQDYYYGKIVGSYAF